MDDDARDAERYRWMRAHWKDLSHAGKDRPMDFALTMRWTANNLIHEKFVLDQFDTFIDTIIKGPDAWT